MEFKDKPGCGEGVYYKGLAIGACGASGGLCNNCKLKMEDKNGNHKIVNAG